MITLTFPSAERLLARKNAAIVRTYTQTPTPFELHQASQRNITVEEYRRRDRIVKDEAGKANILVGERCYPVTKKDYEKYGALVVLGVCRLYSDFAIDDEWPKNDNPFIYTLAPMEDRTKSFFCTRNWVTKNNNHLNAC